MIFFHLFLFSSHPAIPGLHDQTGAGHGGVRLTGDQGHRLLPLLPHHLRHLLRRPGKHQGYQGLFKEGYDKDHLEISRWPIEKNSDNPFFVFCFTLAEVPLRKKSVKYLTANRPKLFHIFCQYDQFPSIPEDARVTKTVSCL